MSQSLAKNLIHLVFSTKNRQPVIIPSAWENTEFRMMKPLCGIEEDKGAECFFYMYRPFRALFSPLIAPRGVAPGWYVDAPSGLHYADTNFDQILPKQTAE